MNLQDRVLMLRKASEEPRYQELLLEACRRDILFWFESFCWTFDPRRTPSEVPFKLYPFQRWFVKELYQAIADQYDIGIEKSRDMGVSWLVILTFQYCWLFHPGWNFHIGSRKEDEVDKRGNISTLMEKARFNFNRLPRWMKPKDWNDKTDDNFMRLRNPNNGNLITGESACSSFGRGGRYRAMLLDEFAFWPFAEGAWTSASQSTYCRVVNSTPYGSTNLFAKLMKDAEALGYEETESTLALTSGQR